MVHYSDDWTKSWNENGGVQEIASPMCYARAIAQPVDSRYSPDIQRPFAACLQSATARVRREERHEFHCNLEPN